MSTEGNKQLVRRWFEEVINQGKTEVVDAICMRCAPGFVVIQGVAQDPPGGLEGVKALLDGFHGAFPDLAFTVEDQVAEGDKVATRLTIRGTHRGEFNGLPATGKSFEIAGTSIWLVHEGQLVQEWVTWDSAGMLQQLGVIPGPV
jgi:steroid delta-isomerase-like uncharacterized protein